MPLYTLAVCLSDSTSYSSLIFRAFISTTQICIFEILLLNADGGWEEKRRLKKSVAKACVLMSPSSLLHTSDACFICLLVALYPAYFWPKLGLENSSATGTTAILTGLCWANHHDTFLCCTNAYSAKALPCVLEYSEEQIKACARSLAFCVSPFLVLSHHHLGTSLGKICTVYIPRLVRTRLRK